MKKLCFVTAARSEYGLLKWLMRDVAASDAFELQLIVTGGHLMRSQGYTVEQIREDGFSIDVEVKVSPEQDTRGSLAACMGKMAEGMAMALEQLQPDALVILGDRYELLPICNTAYVMEIPIIHLSGGDVTEGAMDNGIRNAVTMLTTYHFPGTEDSAENIRRMRGTEDNVWAVGEPGLDAFHREQMLEREVLAADLGLDAEKKWILMTYHPETKRTVESNLETIRNCCKALAEADGIQVVMTYANADPGGSQINELLEETAGKDGDKFKVIPSLGKRYLSMMKEATLVIGNSSSGIVEAPSLSIPVVNIGDRQRGRHLCSNIVSCGITYEEIRQALDQALDQALKQKVDTSDLSYWGDGNTAERILEILKEQL